MSIECGICEQDARAGHADDCPKNAKNKTKAGSQMLLAASAPQADPLKDLWIHEDMARDETAAIVNSGRKELQAAYVRAREDLAHWKRRALEAEAAMATQKQAATAA